MWYLDMGFRSSTNGSRIFSTRTILTQMQSESDNEDDPEPGFDLTPSVPEIDSIVTDQSGRSPGT